MDLYFVVFLGVITGIFHAFDADHIVAMATLVNQHSKKTQVLKYAAKWGGGHGGILLFLGMALAFFGFELPAWLRHYSEMLVGILLIYLGIRLWVFLKRKFDVQNDNLALKTINHDHTPLFIGMLHGVAGSAPVLALLPSMDTSHFLLEIVAFSFGCLFGMFCFGMALGLFQVYVKKFNYRFSHCFARMVSIMSIGLGSYWVFS